MRPPAASLPRRLGLTALTAFSEIMRTGSATGAARVLGLSQPAISRLIARMEQDIGFELFYRDKGRLVPTQDGLMLADEVELALASVARVQGLVRDISTHSVGEIRLIAPPSFASGILPGLIAAFMQRHPRVRFSIDSRSIPTTKTMLATRVVDCAFMRLPLDRDDFIAETIVSSGSVCVLHQDNPLAALATLDPASIGDAPVVTLGTASVFGRQIDQAFRDQGQRQNVAVECHTTSAACGLVGAGIGVAILNELLVRPYVRPPLLVRPFAPNFTHDYAFVVSAQSKLSRLIEEFRDEARRYFSVETAPE
ncbi:MAG: Transcriptional activator for lysine biosynthesis [Sphingomonas bacterium]|uniref:LysR family transcriptional regulator n=1 Tax=Sphingomonas bacterium TaxID=1895847 RepID=UPI00260D4251|nr:LysR family transcriptional regulator [Sphingomonas bacterium]MDB5711803.1 Transcriptional activator for lysine biosynthesis [Sphingomonas bacterium]